MLTLKQFLCSSLQFSPLPIHFRFICLTPLIPHTFPLAPIDFHWLLLIDLHCMHKNLSKSIRLLTVLVEMTENLPPKHHQLVLLEYGLFYFKGWILLLKTTTTVPLRHLWLTNIFCSGLFPLKRSSDRDQLVENILGRHPGIAPVKYAMLKVTNFSGSKIQHMKCKLSKAVAMESFRSRVCLTIYSFASCEVRFGPSNREHV